MTKADFAAMTAPQLPTPTNQNDFIFSAIFGLNPSMPVELEPEVSEGENAIALFREKAALAVSVGWDTAEDILSRKHTNPLAVLEQSMAKADDKEGTLAKRFPGATAATRIENGWTHEVAADGSLIRGVLQES